MTRKVHGEAISGFGMVAVLLILATLLAGCSSTRTAGEQIDDGWINTKIKAKLTGNSEINPFNVDVDVLDGVVTLSGKVEKQETREKAERYARNTKGVVRVVNEIDVEP